MPSQISALRSTVGGEPVIVETGDMWMTVASWSEMQTALMYNRRATHAMGFLGTGSEFSPLYGDVLVVGYTMGGRLTDLADRTSGTVAKIAREISA